jgi:hypothetical protein
MDVIRQLQKITGGIERDFLLLGGQQAGEQRAGEYQRGCEA